MIKVYGYSEIAQGYTYEVIRCDTGEVVNKGVENTPEAADIKADEYLNLLQLQPISIRYRSLT